MIIPIRLYKVKRFIENQKNLLISFTVFIALFFIVLIFLARFNQQKKEVEFLNSEVAMLQSRYDTLKYNKSLTEDQIKGYNLLLASLVPETEDFFSIIYALEQISLISNFQITNYVIDVGNSTNERLSLTAEGKGNADTFLTFLKTYQFSGGRLITSNKIQFGGASSSSTKITLNFYSKKYTFNETIQVPKLFKEEIAKLDEVKKKIKFQFSSTGYQTAATTYETKSDPFSGVKK